MEFLLKEKISKKPNPILEDNTNDLLNKFEKIIAVLRLIPFDLGGLIIKSRPVSYTHLTLPTIYSV